MFKCSLVESPRSNRWWKCTSVSTTCDRLNDWTIFTLHIQEFEWIPEENPINLKVFLISKCRDSKPLYSLSSMEFFEISHITYWEIMLVIFFKLKDPLSDLGCYTRLVELCCTHWGDTLSDDNWLECFHWDLNLAKHPQCVVNQIFPLSNRCDLNL